MNALWSGESGKPCSSTVLHFNFEKEKNRGAQDLKLNALLISFDILQFTRKLFGKCHMSKHMVFKCCR